jgi:hypothetical protein
MKSASPKVLEQIGDEDGRSETQEQGANLPNEEIPEELSAEPLRQKDQTDAEAEFQVSGYIDGEEDDIWGNAYEFVDAINHEMNNLIPESVKPSEDMQLILIKFGHPELRYAGHKLEVNGEIKKFYQQKHLRTPIKPDSYTTPWWKQVWHIVRGNDAPWLDGVE